MNDDKLAKELAAYKELADTDKNIDVASLMIQALQKQQSNMLTDKQKRTGYLISLGLPPFGLLYAVKFYTSGKDDGKQAAYICIGLTVLSLALYWLLMQSAFSSSATNLNQIQQIKPSDVQQLYQ